MTDDYGLTLSTMSRLYLGAKVVAWGHGRMRPAVVVNHGTKYVHVEITTGTGNVYRKAMRPGEVFGPFVNPKATADAINARAAMRVNRRAVVDMGRALDTASAGGGWMPDDLHLVSGRDRLRRPAPRQ